MDNGSTTKMPDSIEHPTLAVHKSFMTLRDAGMRCSWSASHTAGNDTGRVVQPSDHKSAQHSGDLAGPTKV